MGRLRLVSGREGGRWEGRRSKQGLRDGGRLEEGGLEGGRREGGMWEERVDWEDPVNGWMLQGIRRLIWDCISGGASLDRFFEEISSFIFSDV